MIFGVMAAALAGTAPLPPWTVEDHGPCMLVRHVTSAGTPVELTIFHELLSDKVKIGVVVHSLKGEAISSGADGVVTLLPSGERLAGRWSRYSGGDGSSVFVEIPRAALGRVSAAARARVSVAGADMASLPMVDLAASLPLLAACNVARLRSYGVDPAEDTELANGGTAPQPIGLPTGWVRADDYPVNALRAGEQGRVTIMWTVSSQGRAQGCRVLVSSGSESLDQSSCDLIIKRARYQPISRPAHVIMSFNWSLPAS